MAAARAGADVELVCAVGADEAGARLTAFLKEAGIGVAHLRRDPTAPTGSAIVMVIDEDNAVVVVSGANATLAPEDVRSVAFAPGDVVVSPFEISEHTVLAAFNAAKRAGARVVVNPSPVRRGVEELLRLADVVVVNELEFADLAHRGGFEAAPRDRAARALCAHDEQTLVVTLGAAGCVVHTPDDSSSIPGRRADVLDTTGAGDCFLGVMSAQLSAGTATAAACLVANVAASLAVERPGAGAGMPAAVEIDAALAGS